MGNERVFAMKLSKIYPLLVQKAERKNRTKGEVDQLVFWLTGYDAEGSRGSWNGMWTTGHFSGKRPA